jgi:hypothetical protein
MGISMSINGNGVSGTVPLTISGRGFSGSGSLDAPALGGATLGAAGIFVGDAASRAGVGYVVQTSSSSVNGAIAYRKD